MQAGATFIADANREMKAVTRWEAVII